MLRESLGEFWDLARSVIRLRLERDVLHQGTRARTTDAPAAPPKGAPMFDDLRQAWRRLRARPSTTGMAVATLSLAIGISVAMFTVVDALILRPAPFKDPATLAWLTIGTAGTEGAGSVNIPLPVIKAWHASGVFAAVYAVAQEPATFGKGEEAETVAGARVTFGIFDELGVRPLLGRAFPSSEPEAVMIAERLWRTRFGADPSIIGRRVEMSGESLVIVGVLPDAFRFPFFQTRVWRPFNLDQPGQRGRGYAYVRLRPGMPPDVAFAQASDVVRAADPSMPKARVGQRRLGADLDKYSSGIVRTLAAGVGLVFLLLCANVTILMLAAIGARRQEFAVCSALGASRWRLLRQALLEQIGIGAAASILGLSAAAGLVAVAQSQLPPDIVNRTLNPLDIDLRAAAATMMFAVVAVVIAGALPAWIGTSQRTTDSLRMTSRSSTPGRRARTVTSVMLVAEVAFAVALTAAAGLQLRSFVNLLREDRGFDAERLSVFTMTLPAAHFGDGAARVAYAEAIRASLAGVPGVEGASVSRGVPPSSGDLHFYDVTPDTPGAAPVKLSMNSYDVAPDFFHVLGVRIVQGRGFQSGDTADTVVISRSMASALWPGTTAVEHSLSFMGKTMRVVGVVNDIRNPIFDPRQDEPEVYWPLLAAQPGATAGPSLPSSVRLTVRCGAACPPLDAIRARIKSVNALAIVGAGRRIADDYADGLARPRTGAVVAGAFAAIALVGIAGGLFAVMSRLVLQRQREFGIRLALGATPADLRSLVHKRAFGLAGLGILAGTIVAWLLSRVFAAVWYGVQGADPLTWSAVVTLVCATALVAAWRPSRRAMRVNPVSLLRED
jgi:putative ABC transport system permease protein